MKPPEFLIDWFRQMPYHQLAELTIWMDAQEDLNKAIEEAIRQSLEEPKIIGFEDLISGLFELEDFD